jgi:hypothetical protein
VKEFEDDFWREISGDCANGLRERQTVHDGLSAAIAMRADGDWMQRERAPGGDRFAPRRCLARKVRRIHATPNGVSFCVDETRETMELSGRGGEARYQFTHGKWLCKIAVCSSAKSI